MNKTACLPIAICSGIASVGFALSANQSEMPAAKFAELSNKLFVDGQPVQISSNPLPSWLAVGFGGVAIASLGIWASDKSGDSATDEKAVGTDGAIAQAEPDRAIAAVSSSFAPISDLAYFQSLDELKASKLDSSGDWIKRLVLDDAVNPREQHYALSGATLSGKSTLGEVVMGVLAAGKKAGTYLINPKHVESKPDWSFPPFCKSIDDCVDALQHCVELMQQRISDPNFDRKSAPPIFVVVEEWDWIFAVHKGKALSLLRTLIKVGAGLKVFVFLVGQTGQCTGSGLTGSDFRQFARVLLGTEAIAFLSNPQFVWSNRDELKAQAESNSANGKRFALVIPQSGSLPMVELVPNLNTDNKPESINHLERCLTVSGGAIALPKEYQEAETMQTSLAVHRWALRKGKPIAARDIQQAKLPQLTGSSADIIRHLFLGLQTLGYGVISGDGSEMTYTALKVV